jgi:putative cardiolipin synthase
MILRDDLVHPELASIDSRYDVCRVPDVRRATPLEKVFYADRWLSQTCAFPLGKLVLLTDERGAFNAKVEALLGARLPDRFFDAADPEAPMSSRQSAFVLITPPKTQRECSIKQGFAFFSLLLIIPR